MSESRLSKEVLRAHNAGATSNGSSKQDTASHKTPTGRDRLGTMQSESSTGTAGPGRLKLMRLRHRIKLFGGSFSKSGSETHASIQKQFENTYQLEPADNKKFSPKKAERIIHEVLEGYLKSKVYNSKKFPNLSKSLSELIKERVKASGCQRYKIIAHVMIVENQGQSMRHVSRSLWNKDTDNYATATFETKDFMAVGSVFATYFD